MSNYNTNDRQTVNPYIVKNRQTVNPYDVTPFFNTNNYVTVTNPNVSPPVSNRTFGGTSSNLFQSQVFGVKGGSRGLASAGYFNKTYLLIQKPQRALTGNFNGSITYNNSRSTLPNGYFYRTDAYGRQLDSNVPGPVKEPIPLGLQVTPLINRNSLLWSKGPNQGLPRVRTVIAS